MPLTPPDVVRIVRALERVRYEPLVERAVAACAPQLDAAQAVARARDLVLGAADADARVARRLLSPIRADVVKQVVETLTVHAAQAEPGCAVTPAGAFAAMELADDVARAFEMLRPALRGYARNAVGDDSADDVVQQACERLLKYAGRHPAAARRRLVDGFRPYVYVVVKHLCADWHSARRSDSSYDALAIEPGVAAIADSDDDDDGRPQIDAAGRWSLMTRFGLACDGLVALKLRCDAVLERYVADGRVTARQRDGVANGVLAVLVHRATGLAHQRRGRFEVWEVLSDLPGLTRFGAQSLFVGNTTGNTLKQNACGRRRHVVEAIIAEACGPDEQTRAAA